MTQPNKLLIRQSYMETENLLIRQNTHAQYSNPKIDLSRWILTRHQSWRGNERVLDVSPANGLTFDSGVDIFPEGQYIASDLSFKLLLGARHHPQAHHVHFLVSDTEHLAFADNSFDVVLANHMLHHVTDLHATLNELHRVLRPTGILIASTDSQYTMAEFDTLTRRALTLLGRPPKSNDSFYSRFIEGFSLENGSRMLARHFRAVARHEIPSTFLFDDAKPVIKFLNSSRAARELSLPEGVEWEDFITVMADQIRRLISHFGELTVNRLSGVLLATDDGGFAKDYLSRIDGAISIGQ